MTSGWKDVAIGDVCALVGGGTPSKGNAAFYSGNIPWASIRDMRGDWVESTEFCITKEAVETSATNIIPAGNVVIATRVGLGKVSRVRNGTAINQDMRAVIPNDANRLDRQYLFYWFQSMATAMRNEGKGATVKGVTLPFVKALRIPLPPFSEQQRIVGILDEAFAGIAAAKVHAEQNRQNAQQLVASGYVSVFEEAVGGNFQKLSVADVADPAKGSMRTGPFGSQLLHSEFTDTGIAVLGIDNAVNNEFQWSERRYITEGKYRALARYTVKPGDVLITIMGTCGRCAIVPDEIPRAISSKHLCCITLDRSKCEPEFLHGYFLHHPVARAFLEERVQGSIMAGLNMGIIAELPIRLPSLAVQREINRMIDNLREQTRGLESLYTRKLAALDELKNSLLHQAFSGAL